MMPPATQRILVATFQAPKRKSQKIIQNLKSLKKMIKNEHRIGKNTDPDLRLHKSIYRSSKSVFGGIVLFQFDVDSA